MCRKLQLRAVIAALRKQDDVKGVLEALGRVELVIRASPDELPAAAHVSAGHRVCTRLGLTQTVTIMAMNVIINVARSQHDAVMHYD